jgi:hypothetical protein
MSYFAHLSLSFTAEQVSTYQTAKRVLADIGFYSTVVGESQTSFALPRNAFAGQFDGEGAAKIRDDLYASIKSILQANNIAATCFLSVGGDKWAWKRFVA